MEKGIAELRSEIDKLDEEIIDLIAKRGQFVKEAGKLKKNEIEVRSNKRVEEIIKKIRKMAIEKDLDPKVAEDTYRAMINGFINYELNLLLYSY